jgi:hypothetical protein
MVKQFSECFLHYHGGIFQLFCYYCALKFIVCKVNLFHFQANVLLKQCKVTVLLIPAFVNKIHPKIICF